VSITESPAYLEALAQMEEHAARPTPNPGEQQSVEWMMQRCGKVTCSNFRHVIDFTKAGKPTAKRETYLWDVITERLTGTPVTHYVNDAMAHGTEFEPQARMKYESVTGRIVLETGFVNHKTVAGVGGSPDGVIDDDGLIEIKAPTTRTHCQILLSDDLDDYMPQMQGLMWVTGRKWCDFVCYDPRLPAKLQLYISRVDRDEVYIEKLARAVNDFLCEVDDILNRLDDKEAATT